MAECRKCLHKNVCKYTDEKISVETTVKELLHNCIHYVPITDITTIRKFVDNFKSKVFNMKYNPKTHRKTVSVEELKDQINWVLHEVIPKIADECIKDIPLIQKQNRVAEKHYVLNNQLSIGCCPFCNNIITNNRTRCNHCMKKVDWSAHPTEKAKEDEWK